MNAERIADYYIRFTIILATLLVLNAFSIQYNRFEIHVLVLIYLVAIIVSGSSKAIRSIKESRVERALRNQKPVL